MGLNVRIIIGFSIVIFCKACSCKSCVETTYHFSIKEKFSPEMDSIHIGDTLWLIAFHSTVFTDTSYGINQINFKNSLLGTNVRILQFPDTSADAVGAVNDFEIIKINGRETGNDNIPTENKGYYFDETTGEYILKLGFVAKQRGVFSISVGNSMGIIQNSHSCTKANFEIENDNVNAHIYFYQNWRPSYMISDYERAHMYCFKVN